MPAPVVYPVFLPNQGIDLSKPEQFLQNQYSPLSKNMEFYNEKLQGRLGLVKFDEAQLSGPITVIDQFWKFTSAYDLLFGTTKDIYKYDFSNTRFDILTPLYTTGTIEIQAGSLNIVRGTATSWTSANVKAGDFIKIGSGSVHTGSTWYEVESLDALNQQITLTTDAVVTAASTAYVLRQCFTGTGTDIWQAVQYLDDAEGEVWIATNGKDKPIWYNGTGQVQVFQTAELPTDMTAAKYVIIFFNRIVWLWTREGGQNQPIRMRCSEVANFKSYDDLNVWDLELPTAAYWITGAYLKGDYLIVCKEAGAYVGRHIGGDDIYDFEYASTFFGNFSPFSIVPMDTGAYYFGYDNRFRNWNGLRDDTPFDAIFDYLITLDPTDSEFIYGYRVEGKKQIRWTLPYDTTNGISPMIVFDYGRSIIEIWEYTHGSWIQSIGEYLVVEDLYVDDPAWADLYVDEENGFWDERKFLANAPVILYGSEDGYVRKADTGNLDDGQTYTRQLRFKRFDYENPARNKRLWKQQWWFESRASGSVSLKIKLNDAGSFEAAQKIISLIDDTRDKIKATITWNKQFENAQFELTATSQFELLGFLNWIFDKGKVVA